MAGEAVACLSFGRRAPGRGALGAPRERPPKLRTAPKPARAFLRGRGGMGSCGISPKALRGVSFCVSSPPAGGRMLFAGSARRAGVACPRRSPGQAGRGGNFGVYI